MGKWKGIITNIRKGNTKMELYDLDNDIKELNDIADEHPEIVKQLYTLMEKSSVVPKNPNFRFQNLIYPFIGIHELGLAPIIGVSPNLIFQIKNHLSS